MFSIFSQIKLELQSPWVPQVLASSYIARETRNTRHILRLPYPVFLVSGAMYDLDGISGTQQNPKFFVLIFTILTMGIR